MQLIGHNSIKNRIQTALEVAVKFNKSAPHMLFTGVTGCGKTYMAKYIAYHNDVDFSQVSAVCFKDEVSVLEIIGKLNHSRLKPTILFIDEIHRLPIAVQKSLGVAMAEKDNLYFTLIGTTPDDGILFKPFRDRFQMRFMFNTYSNEEIIQIINVHANLLGINITPNAIKEITKRGRGIPRTVIGYLKRLRNLCLNKDNNIITHVMVIDAFNKIGIDAQGFTKVEIKILKALYNAGVPISLENLSIAINESTKILSISIEPVLVREDMIIINGKDRTLTRKGKEYIESI